MGTSTRPLIYLASPYSAVGEHTPEAKEWIEKDRYEEICAAAAYFMDQGHAIFCPISHTHPLVVHSPLLRTRKGPWWLEQDFCILRHCNQLWVYMMPGWKDSYGVQEEIKFAEAHGIPIAYVEPMKREKLIG